MKPHPKLLFALSYIQVIIGCLLAGITAMTLNMFYFVIGLIIIFTGAIVNLKAIEVTPK
jgi:hypothetical protein